MKITQGTFSFLPELSDEDIEAQVKYSLRNGWAIQVEHTDDPHPRNPYWEMWSQPTLDVPEDDSDIAMEDIRGCIQAFPHQYIKVVCYDRSLGRQTSRLSFIVNRPGVHDEPGYRLERQEAHDRVLNYRIHPYVTDLPAGQRYGGQDIPGQPGRLEDVGVGEEFVGDWSPDSPD
ncbi:MAG: ribulose bisphosphate carboxylase small subunit [Actinomycetota bacterium]|nr:ribulose bisphosphate carboxylase small subunit [Actinomycetota bacterium]